MYHQLPEHLCYMLYLMLIGLQNLWIQFVQIGQYPTIGAGAGEG